MKRTSTNKSAFGKAIDVWFAKMGYVRQADNRPVIIRQITNTEYEKQINKLLIQNEKISKKFNKEYHRAYYLEHKLKRIEAEYRSVINSCN